VDIADKTFAVGFRKIWCPGLVLTFRPVPNRESVW